MNSALKALNYEATQVRAKLETEKVRLETENQANGEQIAKLSATCARRWRR